MRLARGDQVDRYVVERSLGEGGMARVYLVRHATLGTRHALKVLLLRSPDLDERFLQEGRVQANLRHPNIVTVTDVLQLERGPALVMDWVAGPSLEQLLDPLGLDIDDALAIFRALVHAVGHAHLHGTIHRDLKPENVLVQLDREVLIPRIADFGLARALDQPEHVRRTRTGMTMGTPTYMAPEQMKDASRCDERADLYALGAMLYELISGHPPYRGSDLIAIVIAQREERHRPLSDVRPETPQWLSELADALLQRDPADRPASCVEVLARLERRPVAAGELSDGAPPIGGNLAERARQLWREPSDAPVEPRRRPAALSVPSVTLAPVEASRAPADTRRRLWATALLAALAGFVVFGGAAATVGALWILGPGEPAPLELPPAPASAIVEPGDPDAQPDEQLAPEPEPARPDEAPPEAAPPPRPAKVTARPVSAPVAPAEEPADVAIRFRVVGDADSVWLRRDGRDFRPGDGLAPGTYAIHAIFGGSAPTEAGSLTVVSGDQPVVSCVAGFQTCARKKDGG